MAKVQIPLAHPLHLLHCDGVHHSNLEQEQGASTTTKEQKWWPSVGYHPRSVANTEATTDRTSHDHTSALCAIRLFIVSNIRQDIFEHILERSLMYAQSAQASLRDRMNFVDT